MLLYVNRTRFPAIVTVRIESTDNPKDALSVSLDGVSDNLESLPACYDILVNPDQEVTAGFGTVAVIVATRNCP